MLRREIIINQRNNRFLSWARISVALIFLSAIFLTNFNNNFLSRVKKIDENIEKIIFFKDDFLIFETKNKDYLLNMKTQFSKNLELDFEKIKVIDIFENENIITLNGQTLENSFGDKLTIKSLESVMTKDNFIIVKADGKYGVLDSKLNTVIPFKYSYISKGEKLFYAKDKNNKVGYFDINGDIQIPFEYDNGNLDINGEIVVYKDGKTGVIDLSNKQKIKIDYVEFLYISPNAIIKDGKKFNFYSPDSPLREMSITWAGLYNGETLFYEEGSKFGLMDKDGNRITENIYDEFSQKNVDAIITRKNEKYGLINQKGEEIVSNIYDYIIPIGNYFFIGGNDFDDKAYVFNSFGNKIFQEDRYRDLIEINRDFILGKDRDEYVLMNYNGRVLDKFSVLLTFNQDWLIYKNSNGINYVNLRGEI